MAARSEGLWIKVYERALDDTRITRIARKLQLSQFDALGRCLSLWGLCYRRRTAYVSIVDAEIVTGELPGFLDTAISVELADRSDDQTLRVRGAEDAIASLLQLDALSELNSHKGRISGKRRRETSDSLQNRTAAQTGFGFGSEQEQQTGSEHNRGEQSPETGFESTKDVLLPSNAARPGIDDVAPPHQKTQHSASQRGFQPSASASPEAQRLARLLLDRIVANNPSGRLARGTARLKTETILRWANSIHKLVRIDSMTWDEVDSMIRWSQDDPFWRRQILGADNLREKWDAMAVQRNTRPQQRNRSQQRPGPTELAMRDVEELRTGRQP